MNKKIYVVGGSINYTSFLNNIKIVNSIEEANIVLFTGGEDVHPSLYNAEIHPTTFPNIKRDKKELEVFKKCVNSENIKLLIGICRGSQFLCVANGGKLIQNIRNHAILGTHKIINSYGDIYDITSTHHQLQYPYNLPINKYNILYWSYNNKSSIHEGDLITWNENTKEPEIVLYNTSKSIKSLAIQGHPESLPKNHETNKMLNNLIDSILE